ncbi:MAG: TIGR00725 family protein [Polyangiaceae bacterium]
MSGALRHGSRPTLAVVGNGQLAIDDPRYALARELGRRAIDAGFRLVCGGRGGVMEAACLGAHESEAYREGDTVGILPGSDRSAANPWVDIPLPTGLGDARNALVAKADVVVAVGGGAGTLSEMALAWVHGRPLIALACEGWSGRLGGESLDGTSDPDARRVTGAETAEEAIAAALAATT